ncbi:aconitate hydratase [Amylibacter marinus]|uniref:Aconitate hydratase A n=1 Tax=Amylibacter marinus TaxID=1475483 RepID=A0ABQ5VUF4_9RHOB|nr:aconitate hydratase AcnA [Amylibacter marinus]GLQ35078.1 aconitate hydratase [Amylibacter marinus]
MHKPQRTQAKQSTPNHTDIVGILGARTQNLPHVLRLLSENHLRNGGDPDSLLDSLDSWLETGKGTSELFFRPNRILMHDTTCTPALADIAGLRDALAEAGQDPNLLTPSLPVEVSVDHSLAVDTYARKTAFETNSRNEIARNKERYAFMKWASQNMAGVRVNPPGTGIMHTINLEQLATVIVVQQDGLMHPDMLLGTDSHTPMINGIGVLGWGIGGLEAESVMFGQSVSLALPQVVGVELTGTLPAGTMPTDLALVVTQTLREVDVTGCFVEFFGQGVSSLSADARAVIANMAPEYGASTGFFPVDKTTTDYLHRTGRDPKTVQMIEPLFRKMDLWFNPTHRPKFNRTVKIELDQIGTNIAGPRRPQDRRQPKDATHGVEQAIGRELATEVVKDGSVPDGAIGVAAITSCTNTSDPRMLIAAGLLARKARRYGLTPPAWVKTSLAPGSPSARSFLQRAGLMPDLASVGFDIVGFGCTTCIGNSGPLPPVVEQALADGKAISAVLSGNRNFPGRVHPKLDLGYIMSPPLVVAYAIKGDLHGNILQDPIGADTNGRDIFLSDLWPTEDEIEEALKIGFRTEDVPRDFEQSWKNKQWQDIKSATAAQFPWDPTSRYLRRPKFASLNEKSRLGHYSAAPLMVLGDDMTTDHISPAGWVDPTDEAGQWLIERGGDPSDLNVYAAYRGNWEVMLRGLFTNRLATNYLSDGLAPSHTVLEDGKSRPVFEAAAILETAAQPTVILAGARYGMGSSRDWAAKGTALLGVRAIIANSFERIHRSNLIGMGVLPLQITDDFIAHKAGLTAFDRVEVSIDEKSLCPGLTTEFILRHKDGETTRVSAQVAVETWQEVEILRCGGILPSILQRMDTRKQSHSK